ncbi:MAG: hypothetical protein IBX41_05350 [Methanophagales archaeon]|nr:hypothetical protein [Methanophagales archaeon]
MAIQSESGRRNALLVYRIFFFMRNRDEKGDKKSEARCDMPIRILIWRIYLIVGSAHVPENPERVYDGFVAE